MKGVIFFWYIAPSSPLPAVEFLATASISTLSSAPLTAAANLANSSARLTASSAPYPPDLTLLERFVSRSTVTAPRTFFSFSKSIPFYLRHKAPPLK